MKWVAQTPEPATRPVRPSQAQRRPPEALRPRAWKPNAALAATAQINAATATSRRSCCTKMQVRTANTLKLSENVERHSYRTRVNESSASRVRPSVDSSPDRAGAVANATPQSGQSLQVLHTLTNGR